MLIVTCQVVLPSLMVHPSFCYFIGNEPIDPLTGEPPLGVRDLYMCSYKDLSWKCDEFPTIILQVVHFNV